MSNTFATVSIKQLEQAIAIRRKIEDLETELSEILDGGEIPVPFFKARKHKGMSAAGRAKIAAAQKARWAKVKGITEKSAKKGRKKMSPAAKAKLAAIAKKRWAKVKAEGKSRL